MSIFLRIGLPNQGRSMILEFTVTDDVFSPLPGQLTKKCVLDGLHSLLISSSHQSLRDHS